MTAASVIWHELECGSYLEDLPLWRELARAADGPVLDVGAGSGRVTLALGRDGHRVTALDLDRELLDRLAAQADGLPVSTAVADARAFELDTSFALCIVPMQTIQLLGGQAGRVAFLRCARRQLRPGALVAVAIADELELFDTSDAGFAVGPLPDVCERDGIVYSSRAIAVREHDGGFMLERRREVVASSGELTVELDEVALDSLSAQTLEHEAAELGLRPAGRAIVPATDDYVGSTVVMLRA